MLKCLTGITLVQFRGRIIGTKTTLTRNQDKVKYWFGLIFLCTLRLNRIFFTIFVIFSWKIRRLLFWAISYNINEKKFLFRCYCKIRKMEMEMIDLLIHRTLPSRLTGVRIIPIIQTRGLALLSSPGISFLSYFRFSDARTLKVTHHKGLLVRIAPEPDDPNVIWSHFVY